MTDILNSHVGKYSDSTSRILKAIERYERSENVAEAHLNFESMRQIDPTLTPVRIEILNLLLSNSKQSIKEIGAFIDFKRANIADDITELTRWELMRYDEGLYFAPY